MLEQYPWIADEQQYFGKPASDFDFSAHDPVTAAREMAKLEKQQAVLDKRINRKVRRALAPSKCSSENNHQK